MQRYFSQIERLEDLAEVTDFIHAVYGEQGVLRSSYHFSPIFGAQNSIRTDVYAHGYSEEWIKLYNKADFRLADPIPARTMAHGAMLTWVKAAKMGPNTHDNLAYFKVAAEHGLMHGFGVPLYGPRGRNSYASFDFGRPVDEIDNEALGIVRGASQAAHQRICVLLDMTRVIPELSVREREVMEWIAQGKSTSSIAAILELSPDTVKTYAKRVYGKLNATDRVGATLKALKLGLIKV